jgi:hypothetical protein
MAFRKFIPIFTAVVTLLCVLSFNGAAQAGQMLDQAAVDAAVKKGVEYLKSQQKGDGSWTGDKELEKVYPYGTTALCLFAIIKGGEPKNSPAVTKALDYLRKNKYTSTYGTSCLILALCALIEEENEPDKKKEKENADLQTAPVEDEQELIKGKAKKAPAWIKAMIKEAVDYLIKVKGARVWRYPGFAGEPGKYNAKDSGDQDASNTQYVIMALYAARRIGINVDSNVFIPIAEYFLENQEQDGPDVEAFRVPGADLNLSELLDNEKEWTKRANDYLKAEKAGAKKEGKEFKGVDLGTEVPRDNPYEKFGAEMPKMKARGWAYLPNIMKGTKDHSGNPQPAEWVEPIGSMTCSGVIACQLAKVYLEKTSWYKQNGKKLEQAIRDGLAWLVRNWSSSGNPKCRIWKYYFFYAVERAGVLTLVHNIGPHDWYYELGSTILATQSGAGSWPPDTDTSLFAQGPLWNTCFAILFLKRATAPIIKEEVIYTGDYIRGGKKDKEPEEEPKEEPKPEEPPAPKGGEENPGE